eukprot:6198114-Pleurochrysis_carterae.AAC.2
MKRDGERNEGGWGRERREAKERARDSTRQERARERGRERQRVRESCLARLSPRRASQLYVLLAPVLHVAAATRLSAHRWTVRMRSDAAQ